MKTIFKYPLEVTDHQQVSMPDRADILSAGLDPAGQLCVWVMVDAPAAQRARSLWIVGTGNPIPDVPLRFVDSVNKGPFMWHVFEELH